MRSIVIGDIHGCSGTFRSLLTEKVNLQKSDALYLLGDLIDRGPDSKGVLDFIFELKENGVSVMGIKGNHEMMMLKAITSSESAKTWYSYGGCETLRSFDVPTALTIPHKYKEYIAGLPFFLLVEDYLLVHAGLNFKTNKIFEDKYSMVWGGSEEPDMDFSRIEGRTVIHGHFPRKDSEITEDVESERKVINIDSGCFYKQFNSQGKLCAFDITNKKLFFRYNIDF